MQTCTETHVHKGKHNFSTTVWVNTNQRRESLWKFLCCVSVACGLRTHENMQHSLINMHSYCQDTSRVFGLKAGIIFLQRDFMSCSRQILTCTAIFCFRFFFTVVNFFVHIAFDSNKLTRFRYTTLQAGVPLPGPGTGQAPVPSVPAYHSAVLTRAVVVQVRPHTEQVELHGSEGRAWLQVAGPAAQQQGAGGGGGLSDDRPHRHLLPIDLKH